MEDAVEVAVQVNGKLRSVVTVARGASQEEAKNVVMQEEAVLRVLEGRKVVKEIYVTDRIYSIVVR